jgi:ubiquinone/menaquinone biosynthesis C-methylase UbiE
MDKQKNAFLGYEANAWFERNKSIVERFNANEDFIINLIKQYDISSKRVLEIGSSAGYRLNGIKEKYPNSEVYGIDPSAKAIEYGRQKYLDINLEIATADKLPFENDFFDIVIVGFVFYVIDRELLFQSIAEIDRVLNNNGFLIICDFFSEKPFKKQYIHILDFKGYSYKQKYEDMFTSSQLYHLIDKSTFYHGSQGKHSDKKHGNDAMSNFDDLFSVILLRKNIHAAYTNIA